MLSHRDRVQGNVAQALVRDIVENTSEKSIQFYLDKYGITYDEYVPLSFAALVAIDYRSRMLKMQNRMSEMVRKVLTAVEYGKKINTGIQREDLEYIFDTILDAAQVAVRPYKDPALNEEADNDKAGE